MGFLFPDSARVEAASGFRECRELAALRRVTAAEFASGADVRRLDLPAIRRLCEDQGAITNYTTVMRDKALAKQREVG